MYTCCHTLSLHDALPIAAVLPASSCIEFAVKQPTWSHSPSMSSQDWVARIFDSSVRDTAWLHMPGASAMILMRSEEHTSELQSLMRISYAVFCLQKKNNINKTNTKTIIISHESLK